MESLKKYTDELIALSIMVIIGLIYRFNMFDFRGVVLLSIYTIMYIVVNMYLLNNIIKSYFTKITLYIYIILDIFFILLGRINLRYFLINIFIYLIILIITKNTEGIVGVKRGLIVLAFYTFLKILYIIFLIY